MATSSTTTSGRSFGAASRTARPSATAPTTSQSGSRSLTKASRSNRWSSASKTRGRFTSVSCRRRRSAERDTDVDPRAVGRLRIDGEPASQGEHALAHADEPEPALDRARVETAAVVDDPESDRVVRSVELHADVLRAADHRLLREAFVKLLK